MDGGDALSLSFNTKLLPAMTFLNAVFTLLLVTPTLGFTTVSTVRPLSFRLSQKESHLDPEGTKSRPQFPMASKHLIALEVNDFQGVARQSTVRGPVGTADLSTRDEKKRLRELHAAGGVLERKRMLAPSRSSTALQMSATAAVAELALKPGISYLDPLGVKPKAAMVKKELPPPDDTFIGFIVDHFQCYRPRHICDPPFAMYEHFLPGTQPRGIMGYVYEGTGSG